MSDFERRLKEASIDTYCCRCRFEISHRAEIFVCLECKRATCSWCVLDDPLPKRTINFLPSKPECRRYFCTVPREICRPARRDFLGFGGLVIMSLVLYLGL